VQDWRAEPAASGTTFGYHFAQAWTTRVSWNRVSSNHERDSDIITAVVGYRF